MFGRRFCRGDGTVGALKTRASDAGVRVIGVIPGSVCGSRCVVAGFVTRFTLAQSRFYLRSLPT